ncbi:hypothetical protein BH925_06135 [Rodentibacter pneumotropicus]|uniref:hypothetical protein n=1 Tax=Rodentibacter pneumotropicus TaxID=758 RepID=UPI000988EE73|nr:hypothetical protein [Rodentibacter pneumotropicus]OOF64651.1 hypothetical protein BH925_06135 [Rodentibacter pneumotropicus]
MKIHKFIVKCLSLLSLVACTSQPITNDYGEYPSNYEEIARQFYQGKKDIKPIDYIAAFPPTKYEQTVNDNGFVIPHNPKIWLNGTMRSGQSIKGYLVCALETNHKDGYKIDALLINNGKVLSVIYNVRRANINGVRNKLCYQEDNWLLGHLEKITRENSLRYIDNFIKQLK